MGVFWRTGISRLGPLKAAGHHPVPMSILDCGRLWNSSVKKNNGPIGSKEFPGGGSFAGPLPGDFCLFNYWGRFIPLTQSQKTTPSRSKIVHRPLPQDAPARRKPVIVLAKKELGWEPRTSLDDGFQKTIRYFGAVLREA